MTAVASGMHSYRPTVPFLCGWSLPLRKLSLCLAICFCAAMPLPAQEMVYHANALVRPGINPPPADFDQTVIPISELKLGLGIESKDRKSVV